MKRQVTRNDAIKRGIKTNYYVEGNTVRRLEGEPEERRQRQLEKEREQRKRKNRRIARRNQERAMHVNLGDVLFFTAGLMVFCSVCIAYIQLQSDITARTKRISALRLNIESLSAENDAAARRIELTTDLEAVKEKALE